MKIACDVSTHARCSPGMSSSPSAVWIQGAFRPCSTMPVLPITLVSGLLN